MKIVTPNIFFGFAMLFIVAMTGCNKHLNLTDDINVMQEVSFSTRVMSGGEKSSTDVSGVHYALIEIDSVEYRPKVYTINGKIYTQAIKLSPGSYTLNRFLMMNDNQTPDDYSDDVIMLATPMEGSDFSVFVEKAAGFLFSVDQLKKTSVSIDVIYFNPSDYSNFGFDFSVLPSTTIRHQIFTGIFNTCNPSAYSGSLYALQTGGLQNRMNAIYRIDVYRNGRFVKSFDNENDKGMSDVVVEYPDGDDTEDAFKFVLMFYGKSGTGFGYKHVHTWQFNNNETLSAGSDGKVHFTIGGTGTDPNTYVTGTDVNLPSNVTFTINSQWASGTLGAYFDAALSNVPSGTSIGNGLYRAWCGTESVSINIQHNYEMDVYSSLYPDAMPAFTNDAEKWNEVNWLFNHLDDFNGYGWKEIQGAVWLILNNWNGQGHENIPDQNALMTQMAQTAKTHPDFIPSCGEKAAVIFVPKGTHIDASVPMVQVVFILSYI
jgi:hypothetical protein